MEEKTERRAYKMNKLKLSAGQDGMYLYYFYDNRKLTSVAVTEEKFDKLVAMDSEFYNNDRRTKDHKVTIKKYLKEKNKRAPKMDDEESIPDEQQNFIMSDIENNLDRSVAVLSLTDEDKEIYELCMERGLTQDEAAERLNKTQSYVAKHLAIIMDTLSIDEDRAEQQWEKYLDKHRTDDDEDILFDMFRYYLPVDEQIEIAQWFYSFREFFKFCLSYLILRPFDRADELEFGSRKNELPYHNRYYLEIYLYDWPDELQWLYLALCEKVESRKKILKEPPSQSNYEKALKEIEEIAAKLGMTAEQYWEQRAMPQFAKQLEKRYTDFRRKHKNMYVVDENDPRPIREQIIEIFGEGPVPVFRNPEFDKKKK
ncbi:MAG: hypothetical protein LUF82_03105 [Clostridia bacterium]|nr:hypothetical protein [Clostridia bacterium]